MKIVILGATGKTGGHAVDFALAAGHEVTAYVRDPGRMLTRAGLTITAGSVEDVDAMEAAFSGADAILSCVGLRPGFRNLVAKVDFQQRMLPNVIEAINRAGVKRFVLLSSFGVGETREMSSFIPRVIFGGIAKRLFADKALAELALPGCRANWTAVYPVGLRKGPARADWELVPLSQVRRVPGIPMLTFATIASVLVELVADETKPALKLLLTKAGFWN